MEKDAKRGRFGVVLVSDSAGNKYTYPLKSGTFVIGNSVNAEIRLKNPKVQGTHCILQIDDNGLASVTPRNTSLPTLLNGKILPKNQKAQLESGDVLSISGSKITYENNASPVKVTGSKPKSLKPTLKLLATPRRGSLFIKHGSKSVSKIPINRLKMIHKRRSSLSIPLSDQWSTHVLQEDVLPSPRNNRLPEEISPPIVTPVTSGELPECAPINRRSRAHKRLSSLAFDKSFETVHYESTSFKKSKKSSEEKSVNMDDSLIEDTPKTALHHSLSYCAAPKTQLKKAKSMHDISKHESVGNTSLKEKKSILKRALGDHADSTIRLQRRSRSIANKSVHNEESSPLSFQVSDEERDNAASGKVDKSRKSSWVKSRSFKQAVKRNKSLLDVPGQTTPVTALNSRSKRSRSLDRSILLSHEMVSSFDNISNSPKCVKEAVVEGKQINGANTGRRHGKRHSLSSTSRKSEILSNRHLNQTVHEIGYSVDNTFSSPLYMKQMGVEEELEEKEKINSKAKSRQSKRLSLASRKSDLPNEHFNQDLVFDDVSNTSKSMDEVSVEEEEHINKSMPVTRRSIRQSLSVSSRKSEVPNEHFNQDVVSDDVFDSSKSLEEVSIEEEEQINKSIPVTRRSARQSLSVSSRKSEVLNERFNQDVVSNDVFDRSKSVDEVSVEEEEQINKSIPVTRRSTRRSFSVSSRKSEVPNEHFNQYVVPVDVFDRSKSVDEVSVEEEEQINKSIPVTRRSTRRSFSVSSRKSEVPNEHFNQYVVPIDVFDSSKSVEDVSIEDEEHINKSIPVPRRSTRQSLSVYSRKSEVPNEHFNQDVALDDIFDRSKSVEEVPVEEEEQINKSIPVTRRSTRRSLSVSSRKSEITNEKFNHSDRLHHDNISTKNFEALDEEIVKEAKPVARRSKQRSLSLASRKSGITSNKYFNQSVHDSVSSTAIITRRCSRASLYNSVKDSSNDQTITSSTPFSDLTEKSMPVPRRSLSRNFAIDKPLIRISRSNNSITSADNIYEVSDVSSTVELSPNSSSLLETTNSSSFSYVIPEKNISGIDSLTKTPELITRRLRSFTVSNSTNADTSTSGSISSLPSDEVFESTVKESRKSTRTPKNDLTDVKGVKTLFKTPKVQNSPANDLTNIPRFKKLYDSLRAASSPKNDLSNLPRFKKIFESPQDNKSPNNDLINIPRFKKIFESPQEDKSPKNDLTDIPKFKQLFESSKAPKSPKNDLSNPPNIKKLFDSSSKVPKSPKNDLTNPPKLKKIFQSPKLIKSPQNDLTNPVKFKSMFATPKIAKSPKNDLTNPPKLKNMFSSPQIPKSPKNDLTNLPEFKNLFESTIPESPKNDLTDVRGLKKLFSTPMSHSSPKNDLTDVKGVRNLLKTPRVPKKPLNDLSNVEGVEELFNTSVKSVKKKASKKSAIENSDYTDVRGVKRMFAEAEASAKDNFNLSGIAGIFDDSSDKFTEVFHRKPIRTYSKSPAKTEFVGSTPNSPSFSSDVVNWVNNVSSEALNDDVGVVTPLLKRSRRLASKTDSINSPRSARSYKADEVDIQTELAKVLKETNGENSGGKPTRRNVNEKKENQVLLVKLTPHNYLPSTIESEDRRSKRTPKTPLKFSEYISDFTKPEKKSETPKNLPKTEKDDVGGIKTRPKRGHKASKDTSTNNEAQSHLKDDKSIEEKEPTGTRTRFRRGVKRSAQDIENDQETDVTTEKIEPVKTSRTRRGKKQEENTETTQQILEPIENKRVTRKRANMGSVTDLDSIASDEQIKKKPRVQKTKTAKSKEETSDTDSIASEKKSKGKSKVDIDTDSIVSDEQIKKTRSRKAKLPDENTKSKTDAETDSDLTVSKKQTRGARSQKTKQAEESTESKSKNDLDEDTDADSIVSNLSTRTTRSQKTKSQENAKSKSNKTVDEDTDTDSVTSNTKRPRTRRAKESEETTNAGSVESDTKKPRKRNAKKSEEDTDSVASDTKKSRTRKGKESEETKDTDSVASDTKKFRKQKAKESEESPHTNTDVFKKPHDQASKGSSAGSNYSPGSVSDEVFTLRIESDTEDEFIVHSVQEKKTRKQTKKVATLKEEAKVDSTTSGHRTRRRAAAKEAVESDNEDSVSSTTSVSTRGSKKQEAPVRKSARSKKKVTFA